MLELKLINSSETIPIRSQILRPGQDLSACIYPHDDDESTFHYGAYENEKLISIVSFYEEDHPNLVGEKQYRFRGMATLLEYRGMGAASLLLKKAFEKLIEHNSSLVWCNARLAALSLYKNLGMVICSEEFDIPGIGPHYLMKKTLI